MSSAWIRSEYAPVEFWHRTGTAAALAVSGAGRWPGRGGTGLREVARTTTCTARISSAYPIGASTADGAGAGSGSDDGTGRIIAPVVVKPTVLATHTPVRWRR